ncbi:MAG: hypothetical protein AAB309_00190 [Deltaproteobacteria bacterium]
MRLLTPKSFKTIQIYLFTAIFTFVTLSIPYPSPIQADESSRESKLREEIFFKAERLERAVRSLLYRADKIFSDNLEKRPTTSNPIEIEEGGSCVGCHEIQKPVERPRREEDPFLEIFFKPGDPFRYSIKHFERDFSEQTHYGQFQTLKREMQSLATEIEAYFSIEDLAPELFILMLKSYLSILSQYLILESLVFPTQNALLLLEKEFQLRIPVSSVPRLQDYMEDPSLSDETQSLFSLIYFKDAPGTPYAYLRFSDTYKTNIEFSSYLRNQNEAAWLNILKLLTIQFLAAQLFHIADFWPDIGEKNHLFLSQISKRFPSIQQNFGALFESKKIDREKLFYGLLAEHLISKEIPTILTSDRYKDLVSHAPRMKQIMNDPGAYLEKMNFIEYEKKKTIQLLKQHFSANPSISSETSVGEMARWLRDLILTMKKNFLHEHLILHFVSRREMSHFKALELEEKYFDEYAEELSLERVQEWLSDFDFDAISKMGASFRFFDFSVLTLPKIVKEIQAIDDEIETLLLHQFHENLAWRDAKIKHLKKIFPNGYRNDGIPIAPFDNENPMGILWNSWGMGEEKIGAKPPASAHNPYDPDPESIPSVLPVEHFPQIKSIENNEFNFKILLSTLLSPLGSDLYLLQKVQTLAEADSKEKLVEAYEALLKEAETFVQKPRKELSGVSYAWYKVRTFFGAQPKSSEQEQHEKDKVEASLSLLKKLGEKLKGIDHENQQTLDDFFETKVIYPIDNPSTDLIQRDFLSRAEDRLAFLKTKRAVLTNSGTDTASFRILDLPVKLPAPHLNTEISEEKPFIRHLDTLEKQNGILVEEVETFLNHYRQKMTQFYIETQSLPFPVERLHFFSKDNFSQFEEAYRSQIKTVFENKISDDALNDMLKQNEEIVRELRAIELRVKSTFRDEIPSTGYEHPEYFIGYEKNRPPLDRDLKRIVELREKRKSIYLDRGGERLDGWIKSYIQEWLIRAVLIEQDLLIRKNIYKIIHAETIDDIKEFILDPFILKQALQEVESMYPEERWRIEAFEKMHLDLADRFSHTLLTTYFESSARSKAFWIGIALSIALAFVPGGQLPSYVIGVILLSDFGLELGHELYESYVPLPDMLENKKGFFRSVTYGEGPGDPSEFQALEDGIWWKKRIAIGSTLIFFIPWARAEWHRTIDLVHQQTNLFTSFKIPYYAKLLGIKHGEQLNLSLIQKRMAEKFGLSLGDLVNANEKTVASYLLNKFGKKEGKKWLQLFRFFQDSEVQKYLWLETYHKCHDAIRLIGFEEGQWPTLEQAKAQAKARIEFYLSKEGHPTIAPEFYELTRKKVRDIEEALHHMELQGGVLEEAPYIVNPKRALDTLGLSLQKLPSCAELDRIYHLAKTRGDAERLGAARYLWNLYQTSKEDKRKISLQFETLYEKKEISPELKFFLELLKEIPE